MRWNYATSMCKVSVFAYIAKSIWAYCLVRTKFELCGFQLVKILRGERGIMNGKRYVRFIWRYKYHNHHLRKGVCFVFTYAPYQASLNVSFSKRVTSSSLRLSKLFRIFMTVFWMYISSSCFRYYMCSCLWNLRYLQLSSQETFLVKVPVS